MGQIGQVNKDFVLCVLTETLSTLYVLLQCLELPIGNRPN